MEESELRRQLEELCNSLKDSDLPALAKVVDEFLAKRSVENHVKWDARTRGKIRNDAIDSLAAHMRDNPGDKPEIDSDVLEQVTNTEPLEAKGFGGAKDSTELRALEATEAVEIHGETVICRDPSKLLSGIRSFFHSDSIWREFGRQRRESDLFEAYILPVRDRMQDGMHRGRLMAQNSLLWLSVKVSHIYMVQAAKVTPQQIYEGARSFVERASPDSHSVTLSTTSGIMDPMERFGTETFCEELKIDDPDTIRDKLKEKSPWRVRNFNEGLLHPDCQRRRLYFFDSEHTARNMKAVFESFTNEDARERYKQLATTLLFNSTKSNGFELYSIDSFKPWMKWYTRSAPNHALISFRSPETRKIAHGVELGFESFDQATRLWDALFSTPVLIDLLALKTGSSYLDIPATVVGLAGITERWLIRSQIEIHLLRRRINQELAQSGSRLSFPSEQEARNFINDLLKRP
jgi:hypothetical protein